MLKKIGTYVGSAMALLVPSLSFANEAGAAAASADWAKPIAAAVAIGLAAFGGALGQGRSVATALEGIARNPEAAGKMTVPFFVGLALIESLVLYALVIALKLVGII